jgi:hypothetical protein
VTVNRGTRQGLDQAGPLRRSAPAAKITGPALAVIAGQMLLFPVPLGPRLQGLIIGLLHALVFLGMMLVHRANRVLNLAQASLGADR